MHDVRIMSDAPMKKDIKRTIHDVNTNRMTTTEITTKSKHE